MELRVGIESSYRWYVRNKRLRASGEPDRIEQMFDPSESVRGVWSPLPGSPPPVEGGSDGWPDDAVPSLQECWSPGELRLDELPPSGFAALELELATGAPAQLTDDDLVAAIVGFDRQISWAQARQARLLAELRRRRDAEYARRGGPCFVPDEVGQALCLSPGESAGRVERSGYLDDVLPDVLEAWENGALDAGKVRIIVDATEVLAPEHAAAVAARVLDRAPEQSKGQLRRAVQRAVITVDPEGAEQRHRAARSERRVTVSARDEGMASFWAQLTATDARACWEQLTRVARAFGKDDPRSMDARRADTLVDVLTGRLTIVDQQDAAAEPARRIVPVNAGKPLVNVVVPLSTLTGADDEPGELPGYGAIPAGLGREVAADGVWRRLVTDPLSGTLLDHGRTTYHPPAGLADLVRARDLRCRGPRCARAATTCELDHHIPHPEGATSAANLVALCKKHHDLKSGPERGRYGWRVVLEPDGGLTWTTPTGLTWTSYPHDYRVDVIDLEHGLDPPPGPEPPPRAQAAAAAARMSAPRPGVDLDVLDDEPPF